MFVFSQNLSRLPYFLLFLKESPLALALSPGMAPTVAAALLAAAALAAQASAAPSAPYAPWAHSHMVWLSSEPSPAFPPALAALLAGYAARNISVGAVDIDSGWATGYNTFVPTPAVFPDWHAFIGGLKAAYNVRVLLWMTSMVDSDSPNFAAAVAGKFLVQDSQGRQATNLSWWHGTGGLLDYSSAQARAWWEAQMAPVLRGNGSAGTNVDGFKCDGTDPYIIELIEPRGAGGALTFAQYSDYYYGHTLNFSRSIVPDALIWSRPVDSFPLGLNISAFLEYSPKYVMFAGWVGDQDPTFGGLKSALINMFESAWRNYTNFGSDTGGYRTGARTRELFCRWAQLNAFLPLFENGGNGDHTPWGFDAAAGGGTTEVTDMYRELVAAHYALAPYLYATGVAAFGAGLPVLAPTARPPRDFPFILQPDEVSDYSFAVGPALFVAPTTAAGVASARVLLPSAGAGWADFWDPSRAFPPGAAVDYATPLSGPRMHGPVFVATHALLPLHASAPLPLLPRHAGAHWAPALTLLCLLPSLNGSAAVAPLRGGAALAGSGPPLAAHLQLSPAGLALRHSPLARPLVLLLRLPDAAAVAGVRGVAWLGGAGAAGEQALAERAAPPPAPPLRDVTARFWDDAAASLSPAAHQAYAASCCGGGSSGSFVREGATLAVMLSLQQAQQGGEVRVAL